MWCRNCNIETNEATCPVCGADTVEDLPIEIYWCRQCGTPVIQVANQVDKGICPICGKKTKYLAKDLRPVFPEERLLLEILLNKNINEFIKSSVWAVNNRYYIDGKSLSISGEMFRMADTDAIAIRESLEKYKGNNSYEYFEKHIETFIKANRGRLNDLCEGP